MSRLGMDSALCVPANISERAQITHSTITDWGTVPRFPILIVRELISIRLMVVTASDIYSVVECVQSGERSKTYVW